MPALDISTITKLFGIFSRKNWFAYTGHDIVHEKIANLLAHLDSDQRRLMLELIDRYEWLPGREYELKIINLFKKMVDEKLSIPTKIYLFPLKALEDDFKTKSGDSIIYLIKGMIHYLPSPYNLIQYQALEHYNEIQEGKFELKQNEAFFIMDDFLGTGLTFEKALLEIQKNKSITNEKVRVVSVVAHKSAIELMDNKKIQYSISSTHLKGISEYYNGVEKDLNTQIMRRIEKKVTKNKSLMFGFQGSEGLITLIRTPNNTFPVFWIDYKVGGNRIPAPFPRYQTDKNE